VALIAATAIGCSGQPRHPFGIADDDGSTPVRSVRPSPLIGTWQVILLVDAETDIQEWRTRWTFRSDGSCRFQRTTMSLVEGISRTVTRDGSYLDRGTEAAVTFDDGTTATLPYSVPLNSTRVLIIEGLQYERIG
jgi:hypothetical protein